MTVRWCAASTRTPAIPRLARGCSASRWIGSNGRRASVRALARAAEAIDGPSSAMIPLVMSRDLPGEVDDALGRKHDPRHMLETLLSEIGDWRTEPAS